MVLCFFMSFSMQKLLGQVRSLQLIVHFMMMQIILSELCMIFFRAIIQYVIFDIIPTDYFYPLIFFFQNDSAYSEQAETLGYVSRYLIINTGSITIFIIANILLQIFLKCLTKIYKKGRIHNFSQKKLASLQWAGCIDFFDDIYMNMSISFMINISMPNMDNASEIGNNTFALVMGACLLFIPMILSYKLCKGYKINMSNSPISPPSIQKIEMNPKPSSAAAPESV